MPQTLRIFVSSPADVPEERLRADLIVDKLSQEYGRFFTIESYRWEHEAMLASKHFQDAIEPPSAFDIVILILWSRLGTPLPEKTTEREYRGIDGRAPVTGTEWEYEEALKVAREKGAPDLLAFRNISPALVDTRDAEARARSNAQLDALDQFWRRHFADRGVFLAAYEEYHTLEAFAQRLEESLRKLIERRVRTLAAGGSHAPIWLSDPFRGLESYEFEHAPIFFGRDATVTKATEQLAANARTGCAFLLVSGASGSGKSSLVKAGIVPRLMKPQRISGAAFLRRAVFRPVADGSGDVFLGLALALTRVAAPDVGLPELIEHGQDPTQLAAHLRNAASEPGYLFNNALGRLTKAERSSGRLLAFENAKLILVVDQFEELFTVPRISPDDRRSFIQALAGLARSGTVWIIATLRADFWHRAAEIPELLALAEGRRRIDLAAAGAAELAEMIRKPAQAAGLSFEMHPQKGLGLDAVLAQDAAAAPGALPLLSFTLDELYKNANARGERLLTHSSYEALGGLEGAIANRADQIMRGLPAAAQAALPRVLRALTTVSGVADQVPVGRAVPLRSFAEGSAARILVDALVAGRLLVAGDETGAAATVRLAHEALISRWQRACDQIAADLRDLETRHIVDREFARWSKAHGYARWLLLLRNPDLANAVHLAKRWGDELDAPTRDFVKLSARRQHVLTGSLAVGLVLALGLAAITYWQRETAVEQRGIAQRSEAQARDALALARERESRGMAALSKIAARDASFVGSIELALAGWPRSQDDPRPRLEAVLQSLPLALSSLVPIVGEFHHDDTVQGAILFQDERRILSWSDDKTVRMWDVALGRQIGPVMRHDDEVSGVLLSRDESRILSWARNDHTARLWDAATGKQIGPPMRHDGAIEGASFVQNDTRVLTWSDDGTLRFWDAAAAIQIGPAMRHDAAVKGALLTRDKSRIVSWSDDKTVRIWDVANTGQIGPAMQHEKAVTGALLGHSENRLLSWSGETVKIWDLNTATQIGPEINHKGGVRGALMTADESRVLSWSNNHTLRMWDVATGQPIGAAMSHDNFIDGAIFIKNDTRILSWSHDETLRIWDAATGQQIGQPMDNHNGWVIGALVTRDESRILSWSQDGTLRLWDMASRQQLSAMPHSDWVLGGLLTRDERHVLSWSYDKSLRLWDIATGRDIGQPMAHEASVNGAALTRDESRMISWSDDKTLRLWDLSSGKQIGAPMQHDDAVNGALLNHDDSRILSWSDDNTLRLWGLSSGKQFGPPMRHEGAVTGALLTADETRVISWSGIRNIRTAFSDERPAETTDHSLRLWNAATGVQIGPPMLHGDAVNGALLINNDSRILSWSRDDTLRIWDMATQQPIGAAMRHDGAVNGALLNRNQSRIVSWSDDKTVRVWDAANNRQTGPTMQHEDAVNGALLTPDESRIVSWSKDKTVRLWDVASGRQVGPAMRHDDSVNGALLTGDGTRIVSWSSDNTLRLWDVSTGKQIGPAMRHGRSAGSRSIWFTTPDNKHRMLGTSAGILSNKSNDDAIWGALLIQNDTRILSWGNDFSLRVWDVATSQQIGPAMRHADEILGALPISGGSRIVSWSKDKTLQLNDASWRGRDLFEIACAYSPPDHDLSVVSTLYGITIADPICQPNNKIPAPDWSSIERTPAK